MNDDKTNRASPQETRRDFLKGSATVAGYDIVADPDDAAARPGDEPNKPAAQAPATANSIGKMAGGLCDDLLSTLLCAGWEKPTLLAPAMNTRMWHNPHVQANVESLSQRGVHLVGPESGQLACGDVGIGRMAEPEQILAAAHALLEG